MPGPESGAEEIKSKTGCPVLGWWPRKEDMRKVTMTLSIMIIVKE
jgi:hypothetical protein